MGLTAMRILSFISDIEKAVIAESPVGDGGAWETSRIVNFHHGLARLSLKAPTGAEMFSSGGTIFVQAFILADGSLCLKASLNWKGSNAPLPVISVYSTPGLNWKLEASRIASAWLEGPPASATTATAETETQELQSLTAVAG
jgi:hypothetical protein